MKRKATTKARTALTQEEFAAVYAYAYALTQEEFAAVKKRYFRQIKKAVKDGKIPPELVINWDQTGVNVVPSSKQRKELQD